MADEWWAAEISNERSVVPQNIHPFHWEPTRTFARRNHTPIKWVPFGRDEDDDEGQQRRYYAITTRMRKGGWYDGVREGAWNCDLSRFTEG